MALSTIQEIELVVAEVPSLLALITAVKTSIDAHKGEGGLDEGLDVAVDVLPQLRDLIKDIESKLPKAAAPPAK